MSIIEFQQASIADYWASQKNFHELGAHLARCERSDLELISERPEASLKAEWGAAAFTATMPPVSILNMAGKLKPFPTLWDGFQKGFTEGLDSRLVKGAEKPLTADDIAYLAWRLEDKGGPLKDLLHDRLAQRGVEVAVVGVPTNFGEERAVTVSGLNGTAPQSYVSSGGRLHRHEDLPAYMNDLRKTAEEALTASPA